MSPENSHSERSTLKYHKRQLCLGTGPLKRKLKLEEVTRDCLCAQREDHIRSYGETAINKSRRETFDLELYHGLVASKNTRKHISVILATWWAVFYCGSSSKSMARGSTGPSVFSQEAAYCSVASQKGKSLTTQKPEVAAQQITTCVWFQL